MLRFDAVNVTCMHGYYNVFSFYNDKSVIITSDCSQPYQRVAHCVALKSQKTVSKQLLPLCFARQNNFTAEVGSTA